LLARVIKGSPAESAGLLADDVLVEFDGKAIRRYSDLPPMVGVISPGTELRVKVIRAGKAKFLTVKIGVFDELSLTQSGSANEPESDNPLNIIIENAGSKNGVVVLGLLDGPARRAGLRKGDIITMMRNEFVRDKGDFDRIVSDLPENGAVAVRILRGENIVYLAIPTK